jgi:hypothetical protein
MLPDVPETAPGRSVAQRKTQIEAAILAREKTRPGEPDIRPIRVTRVEDIGQLAEQRKVPGQIVIRAQVEEVVARCFSPTLPLSSGFTSRPS